MTFVTSRATAVKGVAATLCVVGTCTGGPDGGSEESRRTEDGSGSARYPPT